MTKLEIISFVGTSLLLYSEKFNITLKALERWFMIFIKVD